MGSYDTHFSYDDLNQITEEKGHFNNTYIFDSLNNRRNKNGKVCTLDDLNRLTSDSINSYGSDKNGYRTSKNEFNYSYDALERLLSVSLNDDTITYSYDSFSRRLSRTSDQISVQYLYQFDTEIAALENNKIVEFKAIHGQFSPYAIELNDKVYTPIRNHRGDITVLLDTQKNAVSTNRYDAFGEFSHYGSIQSPWLFSSQRYDTSTKNYHFINREYDSYTGRWLTPDPLGFEDGLNLYAYVHNNPMIYVDPYGLWAEDSNGYWSQAREFGHSFSRGFVDDASFGLTSLTMGEHETPNFNSKAAYYTGSACSLGAGLLYGGTWVKGAAYTGKTLNYGCKLLRNAFTTTKTAKTLVEGRTIAKLAQESSTLIKKTTEYLAKSELNYSKTITNSNGYLGRSGWELFNTKYQDPRNYPCTLNNYHYTGHALDQMQNRGIMPSVVENTLKNGCRYPNKIDTIGFFDPINDVRVITDETANKIITVIRGAPNVK